MVAKLKVLTSLSVRYIFNVTAQVGRSKCFYRPINIKISSQPTIGFNVTQALEGKNPRFLMYRPVFETMSWTCIFVCCVIAIYQTDTKSLMPLQIREMQRSTKHAQNNRFILNIWKSNSLSHLPLNLYMSNFTCVDLSKIFLMTLVLVSSR